MDATCPSNIRVMLHWLLFRSPETANKNWPKSNHIEPFNRVAKSVKSKRMHSCSGRAIAVCVQCWEKYYCCTRRWEKYYCCTRRWEKYYCCTWRWEKYYYCTQRWEKYYYCTQRWAAVLLLHRACANCSSFYDHWKVYIAWFRAYWNIKYDPHGKRAAGK